MNGYEPISPQISKLNPPTIPFTESLRDLKIVSELVKEGIFRELIVGYLRRNEIILNLRLDLPPCPDGNPFFFFLFFPFFLFLCYLFIF